MTMLHHHLSAFFLLVVVPALALSATLNREDLECRACYDIELSASNGMNIEYSRYMGTWQRIGLYDERPYYMCINDCQQLTDQLIWHEGQWSVVDCRPESNEACGSATHHMIQSTRATNTSCPYEDHIMPFVYCSGAIIPGGGCTEWAQDESAKFSCA